MEMEAYAANDPGALYAKVDKKRKRQGSVKAPATTIELENYYSVTHSTPAVASIEKNDATLPVSARGENGINAEYSRLDRDTLFNSNNGPPSPGNAKNGQYSAAILPWVFTTVSVILLLFIAAIIAFAVVTTENKSAIASLNVITANTKSVISSLNITTLGIVNRTVTAYQFEDGSVPLDISNFYYYASSCEEYYSQRGFISPGYYLLKLANGSISRVYCHMTLTSSNVTGGWMRVAKQRLDGEPQCFPGFSLSGNQCRRKKEERGCSRVLFSALGLQYSFVFGRILAYGEGSPDGFHSHENNISAIYVDGISLTQGVGNARRHIYTFAAAGSTGYFRSTTRACEQGAQTFVNSNFACLKLRNDNSCPSSSNCSPSFSRSLDTQTSEDLEMRVCRNQDRNDEDILLQVVELYIH